MSEDLNVIYFPPSQNAKPGQLGGGYIVSGVLKTRFQVRSSDKSPNGIWVTLPSFKQGEEWVNPVEFPNKEASERVENIVLEKMRLQGVQVKVSPEAYARRQSTPQPSQVQPQPAAQATSVTRNTPGTGVPIRPPF